MCKSDFICIFLKITSKRSRHRQRNKTDLRIIYNMGASKPLLSGMKMYRSNKTFTKEKYNILFKVEKKDSN